MPSDPQPAQPPQTIDARSFWRAIGCRAIGVAVVAARDEDGPAGFLALSATHLSADPPRMMISVDARTSARTAILASKRFAISYLRQEQQHLVDVFGGKTDLKGADRFQDGQWTTLTTGAPVLDNAIGVLDCEVEETFETQGTTIIVGRLVGYSGSAEGEPLISFRGGYR